MKIAIATTTIHTPHALKLLLAHASPDVCAFVTADEKTPLEAYQFCADLPACEIYSPERQRELGYACSDLLGWSTITRRSIAILEALRWGAEIIISWDDDNLCLESGYFYQFKKLFQHNKRDLYDPGLVHPTQTMFSGLQVGEPDLWFDPGSWQFPRDGIACQRGFPQTTRSYDTVRPVTNARIGLAQGLVLGDPDTSAVDRLSCRPVVHQVSELYHAGVVLHPQSWAPVNSQNTAFLRELAPCFLMCPQFGRSDDIFAGLVAQRVMKERGLHVHFGKPYCWQSRNPHNVIADIEAEIFGMRYLLDFAELLDSMVLPGKSVLEDVYTVWEIARSAEWMPEGIVQLSRAWTKDCEKVL